MVIVRHLPSPFQPMIFVERCISLHFELLSFVICLWMIWRCSFVRWRCLSWRKSLLWTSLLRVSFSAEKCNQQGKDLWDFLYWGQNGCSKSYTFFFSLLALGHWEEFRQAIDQKDFPCLRQLYFLICFPASLYEEFEERIVPRFADLPWPLTNLAYHCEEQLLPHYPIFRRTKGVLLLYTSPLEVVCQYTRVIFNHSFAQKCPAINRPSLTWMCNRVESVEQLDITLNNLLGAHVKLLDLHFYGTKVWICSKGKSIGKRSFLCFSDIPFQA